MLLYDDTDSKMESTRHRTMYWVYRICYEQNRSEVVKMATNKPWNSTKKSTESWKKMSIIYIIFLLLLFSRLTLITIYIDLRLVWHWFSSEVESEHKKINDAEIFLLPLDKDVYFHQKIFSVRMLFIFLTVTLLWFDILLVFFSWLLFVLVLTHLSSSSFNKTLFSLICIETKIE